MLSRRAFLASCVVPLVMVLVPSRAVATERVRQWYGHIPEGWIAIPVSTAAPLPFVPRAWHLVWRLNADGSIVPLYLVS